MKQKEYNTLGMEDTCLNCGKNSCALAGVGNVAQINENDGCWIPQRKRYPEDYTKEEQEQIKSLVIERIKKMPDYLRLGLIQVISIFCPDFELAKTESSNLCDFHQGYIEAELNKIKEKNEA